jgi:hypothetical protein
VGGMMRSPVLTIAEHHLSPGEVRIALQLGLSVVRIGESAWILRTRWTAHLPHWYPGIPKGYRHAVREALERMREELDHE